ncbi:hypothetical protein OCS_05056 [Ophiocordyceps sinensis CO18]|uniref:Uncharacterized protein n=1 Tax=Ophiocordyceps sinensis (strain Co18 / CGMCC 3.14243) TaxID=911162 RepID=T5ABX6_OPHSC|nr:hypothetical protein OCS_05056 [Ophiocordyceps sinensis CO18]
MSSFVGRLSKHSNRSQPAIAEQPLSPTGPGLGFGSGGAPAAGNSCPGLLADSPAEATPLSTNTTLSSSEPFVDALQNLASQPSSHLCNPQSAGSNLNPASLLIPSLGVAAEDSSPAFNGPQRFQTPLEQQRSPPPPPLNLASQRLHLQQQQQFYDIASASVDQVPGPDVFQQSQTATGASEKRSTRKLIKGIFSSSGRTSHDPTHQHKSSPPHGHHSPYDNTAGLARHSSKRDSRITLPNTTIRSVPGEQLELSSYEDDRYQPPDHPPPPQQPQPHPLQRRGTLHVQEHQVLHEPQGPGLGFGAGITLPNTTIRSVPGEQLELSSYEDDRYQPPDHPPPPQQPQPHPLQRRGTLHVQEHQVLHEPQAQQTASYDQPLLQTRSHGLQHPHLHLSGIPSQGPHEQFSEPHIVPSHSSAVLQQQNPETISQLSYDSWITDSDQRSLHQQTSVQTSPAAVYPATLVQEAASAIPKPTPTQNSHNHSPQQPAMVPPGGVPPPNRRLDVEKALRGQAEPAPGPATGYRQGSVSTNPMSPLPPTSGQNLSYRGDRASQYELYESKYRANPPTRQMKTRKNT